MTRSVAVDEACEALLRGEVVALPTDTVYGLGVRADLDQACEKVFALKGRPDTVALPVLVDELNVALLLTDEADQKSLRLLGEAYWPGPLSVVVRRSNDVRFRLGGDEQTIGLRIPENAAVRELAKNVGPLAVSSANRHGESPCQSADDIREIFGEQLRTLDGGTCDGEPSTVVSITDGTIRCFREGPVAISDIADLLDLPVTR